MNYDLIVLGSGPAGLAAAVAARSRGKSALVIGNRWQDSPLAKAERIDNYLGLPGRTGYELLEEFQRHAETAGVDFVVGRALSLMAWNGFTVTVGSDAYQGGALVMAPGVVRQAKFPGEQEYLGSGVSYCATCDGMLYRGKDVLVVGRTGDAPEEAAYLQSIGCRVTYTAPKRPEKLAEDIPFLPAGKVEIRGEKTVTAAVLDGVEHPCACVFILRASLAPTDLLPTLELDGGYIRVDRAMQTSVPGVFACGDCTGTPLQVAKAVGEGHIAGLSACEYLDRQKG
ncbi:MAG: FAD-binding protein [Ruminococcaceae bacterium]|jgi:thioredoxin reductase (NADPH)|nr:FAD-binding protein [Oscillospiraceae bacterium]